MKTKISLLCLLALPALTAVSLARAEDTPATPSAPTTPAPAAPAQPKRDWKKMRERRMTDLDAKLSLTADQKAKINAIWDKSDADAKALRDDDSLSREDMREKVRDLMKVTHDQVRAVLTADQQKTFDTMKPERRRGPRPDGEGPPPPPPAPGQ